MRKPRLENLANSNHRTSCSITMIWIQAYLTPNHRHFPIQHSYNQTILVAWMGSGLEGMRFKAWGPNGWLDQWPCWETSMTWTKGNDSGEGEGKKDSEVLYSSASNPTTRLLWDKEQWCLSVGQEGEIQGVKGSCVLPFQNVTESHFFCVWQVSSVLMNTLSHITRIQGTHHPANFSMGV